MAEFKVLIEVLDCVTVNAESADAAWEQVKQKLDPRVLAGPMNVQILPVEEETATVANQ